MLSRILALILVVFNTITPPSAANAGILKKGAAIGIVVGGARLAQVVAKISPLAIVALRLELAGSGTGAQLITGLQQALNEHKILGPKVLIETLARSVANDFSLHQRAIEIARQTGINIEALLREEEKEIAKKVSASRSSPSPDDPDPCGERAGNDGPYRSREIREKLMDKYGPENLDSSTIPPTSMPNVQASAKGLSVEGVPFDPKGFPIFDKFVKVDLRFGSNPAFQTLKHPQQMAASTKELGRLIDAGKISTSNFTPAQLAQIRRGVPNIDGLTWHHHQDIGRMQLVPRETHRNVKHVGGWFTSRWCRRDD